MKKKLLFGMLAVIMCFTLTGCGKSEIEKFKEYLVEEAGYEEKNVDYFILKKDGEALAYCEIKDIEDLSIEYFIYESKEIPDDVIVMMNKIEKDGEITYEV